MFRFEIQNLCNFNQIATTKNKNLLVLAMSSPRGTVALSGRNIFYVFLVLYRGSLQHPNVETSAADVHLDISNTSHKNKKTVQNYTQNNTNLSGGVLFTEAFPKTPVATPPLISEFIKKEQGAKEV